MWLRAPGPTVLDGLLHSDKVKPKKSITTIEEWMLCFNTYVSVVAMHSPELVRDLLAYSPTIIKASQDVDGSSLLEYDAHFRKQLATQSTPKWATIDASLWTMHFVKATPKTQTGSTQGDIKGPHRRSSNRILVDTGIARTEDILSHR